MDFTIEYTNVRDEPEYQRDGTIAQLKRATFYIGKHGPFTEKIPAGDGWETELHRRAEALRRTLQGLPR